MVARRVADSALAPMPFSGIPEPARLSTVDFNWQGALSGTADPDRGSHHEAVDSQTTKVHSFDHRPGQCQVMNGRYGAFGETIPTMCLVVEIGGPFSRELLRPATQCGQFPHIGPFTILGESSCSAPVWRSGSRLCRPLDSSGTMARIAFVAGSGSTRWSPVGGGSPRVPSLVRSPAGPRIGSSTGASGDARAAAVQVPRLVRKQIG